MKKEQQESYNKCPVEATIALIQGKWKVMILFRLMDQPRRFNELSRLLPHATQRVLTNQLRELERDGLIDRKVYPEIPPKVEYSLTELAISLLPILHSLKDWGKTNILD